jgi:epoxyqueuosine reductase
MNSSKVNALQIITLLDNNDFKAGIVSINRIQDLRKHVASLYTQKLFDETFYEERLTHFDFNISNILANAQSIIVATTKQPIIQVEFSYQGIVHKIIVPPTYDDMTDKHAFKILTGLLEPEGFKLREVSLPEKLLLVMSGIAKYGRNNIAYVKGMGSFHRPVVFITDAKLVEMEWISPEIHEKCIKCKTCIKYCPTGAISKDQFLLKAEKCLTFYNERNSSFPEWIKSEWHNCLIGCMMCQNKCPLNEDNIDNIESVVTFSEQETLEIIRNKPLRKLSRSTIDKLEKINLFCDYNLLGRNLSVLVKRNNC